MNKMKNMESDGWDIKDARMVSDIKRVFASEKDICPDVEAELARFHTRQRNKKRQATVVRISLAAIATAAAILAFVFIINPASNGAHHEDVRIFTAISDNTLSITSNTSGDKTALAPAVTVSGNSITVAKTSEPDRETTIKTPGGEFYTVTLPDGTVVKLNAQSTFRFTDEFASDHREVYLKGEAYFDVHHDPAHPFIVKTDYFEAKALGTSFNVRAYTPEQANVTLVEGRLEVSNGKEKPVTIKPNEQTSVDPDGRMTTIETDTYQYTEWQNGVFYFDDISLRDILREIGRWYNIDVDIRNTAKMGEKLHFVADRHADISDAITNLNALGNFNVVKQGNKIILL